MYYIIHDMGDINNILHLSSSCVSCLADETEPVISIINVRYNLSKD